MQMRHMADGLGGNTGIRRLMHTLPRRAVGAARRLDVIPPGTILRGLNGYDICRKRCAELALRDIPTIRLAVRVHSSVAITDRAACATIVLNEPAASEVILVSPEQAQGRQNGSVLLRA